MKVYTDKEVNEIAAGLAALEAELKLLRAVAGAARDVRNWLNGLRGVRKPPCDIELHLALCALDALDVKDSGGCGGDDAWWTG